VMSVILLLFRWNAEHLYYHFHVHSVHSRRRYTCVAWRTWCPWLRLLMSVPLDPPTGSLLLRKWSWLKDVVLFKLSGTIYDMMGDCNYNGRNIIACKVNTITDRFRFAQFHHNVTEKLW
jgi:hypothetical protein